ncbi:uncharacterized protein [Nicotiana sylvestris]|uniref:uncharacterized protein n=1 Tax=Nicotiana sylvestris TaxID=4096 RepID=UPI00388C91F1
MELEGKMRKRVTDCQKAEGNEGGHLARAFLLVGSDQYHTRSRGSPPPPLSNTKGKLKAILDDLSGIQKENVENAETSDGRSTLALNDLVLRLEQKILELQGELEKVRNLANFVIVTFPDESVTVTCNEATQHENSDSDEEDEILGEVVREVENFENKPKSNLDETEAINLGDTKTVKETRISIYLSPTEKEEYIRFLKEYEEIFAWSYDDMTGLSMSIVAHKLPTNLMCPLVKQKLQKFKPDISLKIKEEVTKQIKAKVLRVMEYPTWLANIVSVPKKNGKVIVCVNYQDLIRASPKDDFPLPNIHILIDNCAKHKLQSL